VFSTIANRLNWQLSVGGNQDCGVVLCLTNWRQNFLSLFHMVKCR